MNEKIPYTPLSTRLSGSAKETEIRLKNIFSGPKKRPPILFLVLMFSACVFCGNLVAFRSAEAAGPNPAEDIHAELWADDPMMERYASLAVPSFLTEDQQELYRRARALYQAMFGGDTIWIDWFYLEEDKPRAEGSIPSAPAIQRSETVWFRSFFGTFWAACFRQTADDAILMLKLLYLLAMIPTHFVCCSIKKASKHQLLRLGKRQLEEPLYCFMRVKFFVGL